MAELLSPQLSQHPALETLDLSSTQLKPAAAAALAEYLAGAQAVAVVKLQQCRLGDAGVKALTEGLTRCLTTGEGDVDTAGGAASGCSSSSQAAQPAAAGTAAAGGGGRPVGSSSRCSGFTHIRHLNLAGNGLTSKSAGALGQLLGLAGGECAQCNGGAGNGNMGPSSGSSSSCNSGPGQLALQYLSLAENEIEVIGPLCDGLRHAHKLLELDLHGNRIRGEQSFRFVRQGVCLWPRVSAQMEYEVNSTSMTWGSGRLCPVDCKIVSV